MMEAAAEEALRTYCAPSLIREYDGLGMEAKHSLLDALVTGERDCLFQTMVRQETTKKKDRRRPANRTCPLVRAFAALGVNPSVIHEDEIEMCRQRLSVWGDDNATHPTMKLIRYQQKVARLKQDREYQDSSVPSMLHTNKCVVKTGQKAHDWSQLRKVLIKDLGLFQTSYGCQIEGTIVGEAIQPMVGGTTLMRDEAGDVLIVCFYNMLPDGLRGADAEPLLLTKVSGFDLAKPLV